MIEWMGLMQHFAMRENVARYSKDTPPSWLN